FIVSGRRNATCNDSCGNGRQCPVRLRFDLYQGTNLTVLNDASYRGRAEHRHVHSQATYRKPSAASQVPQAKYRKPSTGSHVPIIVACNEPPIATATRGGCAQQV